MKRVLLLVLVSLIGGSWLFAQGVKIPPVEAGAMDQLKSSPRHGEWITYDAGNGDKVDAFVVYPERKDKAPVLIVIHEIFGMSDWVRSVGDQYAAEGYLTIAPDLLSGKGPGGKGTSSFKGDEVRAAIGKLDPAEIARRLDAAAKWATAQPSARKDFGVVGYCWGGGVSFAYATQNPNLAAAVVFYGVTPADKDGKPDKTAMAKIKAPVLGLYGGTDARITSNVPATADAMKTSGKRYESEVFDGAGHGFLRQQDGQNGANLKAAQGGWVRSVKFLKDNLENKKTATASFAEQIEVANAFDCCDMDEMDANVSVAPAATEHEHLH